MFYGHRLPGLDKSPGLKDIENKLFRPDLYEMSMGKMNENWSGTDKLHYTQKISTAQKANW